MRCILSGQDPTEIMKHKLIHGDCLEKLKELPDNSVDSVVTDPPYGLSFMGKKWDYDVPSVEVWAECLRVLKPGGHLLAFAGTRTQHRMAVRIEDAGFEIRDMIAWVYGSGFPKSLDVSKAIDKAAGAEREVIERHIQSATRPNEHAGATAHITMPNSWDITAPATDAARQWEGWGTALKPALEPITVARKPLEGTVAANVLAHGTGALNVDGCRVAHGGESLNGGRISTKTEGWDRPWKHDAEAVAAAHERGAENVARAEALGRWPANLVHDGSEEVVGLFPQTTGVVGARREGGDKSIFSGGGHSQSIKQRIVGGIKDSGSAARFFKCCPPDATCPLCYLPYAEACDNLVAWKNILASTAEKHGWTSQATSEFIARVSAIGPASERIVPNVKSAGNLCDSCAISIAVALVGIKTSAFSSAELQATLASTGSCNASILTKNLASFAELWASTDTTPTTNSLSLLFGCVRDAIASFTRPDTKGRVEPRYEPSRFAYFPKASKKDRDEGLDSIRTVKHTTGLCKNENMELAELLQKATSESIVKWGIDESGASITGLCLSDSLSTTLTEISKITASQICNLWTRSHTNESIAAVNCVGMNGGSRAESVESSSLYPPNTTSESQAESAHGAKSAVSKMLSAISDGENWKRGSNFHATVKPTDLMRYLCRLVTPPGGVILDPFMGSGSTGKAAMLEGFNFIGIEREAEYIEIAKRRIGAD
jgi:hypothetical protein